MSFIEERTPVRKPGELTARELLRWWWRQLTSMRTALVLLLLLALAAVPGSLIPQAGVDAVKSANFRDDHPRLAPVFDWLGLFSVYSSPWFAAIYLLLMVSLVGCILPRTAVYWRALRAAPPPAPRRFTRLPAHTSYRTSEPVETVVARAEELVRGRRFRVATGTSEAGVWVAGERGYLREAGNLLFHMAVIVALVGFAIGSMFGYRGGVIVLVDSGFSNNLTQYDDFAPGSLFDPDVMEPFSFDVTDFSAEWLYTGPRAGMAQKFVAPLTYRESPDAPTRSYDLRVNHPLTIGGTEVFLIGHGYAPVITVRDGNGQIAYSGPTVFLPIDRQTFRSFGVVKAPDARPDQVGLMGELYPTYAYSRETGPYSTFGQALDPFISMTAYTGDLGMDAGAPQSVYNLQTDGLTTLTKPDGALFRVDLRPGERVELPDGAGSVSFDGLQEWVRVQISRTPGKMLALGGVVAALIGLLLSLFVRPRRVWVRVRREGQGTLVEVAGLDRADGGELQEELAQLVAALSNGSGASPDPTENDQGEPG